jgi:CheY-like chemotaxis protein
MSTPTTWISEGLPDGVADSVSQSIQEGATKPSAKVHANGGGNGAGPLVKKKRVLLVDTSRTKRDLRSETMRRLGVEVDCAADIVEARCWWRPDLYDLVLLSVDHDNAPRDKFCDDVRSATPPQQIMFLVGKPEYLAMTPGADSELGIEAEEPEPPLWSEVRAALLANRPDDVPLRWGILEACRRISAVRSVSEARSRAMRSGPAPVRDSDSPRINRVDGSDTLAVLIREEMQ